MEIISESSTSLTLLRVQWIRKCCVVNHAYQESVL